MELLISRAYHRRANMYWTARGLAGLLDPAGKLARKLGDAVSHKNLNIETLERQ